MEELAGWHPVPGNSPLITGSTMGFIKTKHLYTYLLHDSLLLTSLYLLHRIAVYKAIYPSLGTLTDLVAAIDQVTTIFVSLS